MKVRVAHGNSVVADHSLVYLASFSNYNHRMISPTMLFFLVTFLFACTSANLCTKPEVSASAYTTQDATVLTNIAFVAEFTLKCGNQVSGLPLYAEINGKTLPAARVGDDNRYQVSWTEEVKKARSGDYSVNLYDEEGYAAMRKAIRSGEDPSSVKPLVTVVVNHPGAYQGPWVNSEFMAAVLSVFVWYLAFSAKSKLLA